MELNVVGGSPMQVSEVVFNRPYSEALIHQVVTAYRNAGRSGTKAQKTRSQMSGIIKKFKKQKGGGARHGDYCAPIFVGGGRAFAVSSRSFAQKVNRKMFRGAMASILSELNRTGRLRVVENFGIDQPKTKTLVAKLAELEASGRCVLVAEGAPAALYQAAGNIPYVHVVEASAIDPVSLVGADHVLMTVDSIKKIEEWLA